MCLHSVDRNSFICTVMWWQCVFVSVPTLCCCKRNFHQLFVIDTYRRTSNNWVDLNWTRADHICFLATGCYYISTQPTEYLLLLLCSVKYSHSACSSDDWGRLGGFKPLTFVTVGQLMHIRTITFLLRVYWYSILWHWMTRWHLVQQ